MARADDSPTNEDLADSAASDAKILGELLRENWTVQAKGNEIKLTSKFEIFHIGMVSRSGSPPEFSDGTPRNELVAETKPRKYVIRLRYEKKISKEELQRRRIARQEAADVLMDGARTREGYQKAGDEYAKIRVPRYRSDFPISYHIFEDLTETPYAQIYPPKAVQKVGGAKEILAILLRRIRTGND